jgi:chromosome segregation ATPase
MVRELTNKNKQLEANIHLMEVTAKEIEITHTNEVEHFERNIRELNQQINEQQTYAHNLKTENNSMKIQINQLSQTVEGQKAAYENLRAQLADVYKEKHSKANMETNLNPYVPKVTVNMTSRDSSYNRKDTRSLHGLLNEPEISEPKLKGWVRIFILRQNYMVFYFSEFRILSQFPALRILQDIDRAQAQALQE